MFLNIILKDMINKVEFELKCPYRANIYTVKNLTMYIPPIIPAPQGNFCLTQKVSCIFSGSKNFKQIAFLKYIGNYKK
jgi:hypothetical protein